MLESETINNILKAGALAAAPRLIGCVLTYQDEPGVRLAARIVETESYPEGDPSTYKFTGKTLKQSAHFAEPGTVYMHFSHGKYNCLNISCLAAGRGESVLIRAVEPLTGTATMWQRRYAENMPGKYDSKRLRNLTSGPGKLIQAFGLTKAHNGVALSEVAGLNIVVGEKVDNLVQTTRIGLTEGADKPWRWYDPRSSFISKK